MSEVHKFYIKGHEVLIDKDKVELVIKYTWCIVKQSKKSKSNWFCIGANAKINGKWTIIKLHRLLMNAKEGQIIDHINRNTLDNRLCNLRFATRSQNSVNVNSHYNSSSNYLGVSIDKWSYKTNRFRSQIRYNNKVILLGCYLNEIEAAKAYNEAAIKYHGEFANLNKI